MLEPREFEGYWWLPSDPDTRLPGTLTFSQKDVGLELLGSFADSQAPNPFEAVADQPRILGIGRDRRPVTLDRCVGLGTQINLPGFAVTTYAPHLVLVGCWYEADEEIRFDEISVRLSDLDSWTSVSGFRQKPELDETRGVTALTVQFSPPPSVEVDLDGGRALKVDFGWTWSGAKAVTTEVHVAQQASLRLTFDEAVTVPDALSYVAQLRNFISLGVGRPISVLSVTGWHLPDPDAKVDAFTKATPRKTDVEILYRMVGLPEPPERDLLPDEMLFTLRDVHSRLKDVLQAWFDHQDLLRPVLARYFHLVHAPSEVLDQEFEGLVRVLETHHRRVAADAVPTAEHESRISEIISSVPPSHREWLEKKLAYSHEPTLGDRLKGTLGRCPTVSRTLIGSAARQKSFVGKVVVTRNYHTHLDPSLEREAVTGADLLSLIFKLRALVEMVLLLDIGFTCDDVNTIFARPTRRYERAALQFGQ